MNLNAIPSLIKFNIVTIYRAITPIIFGFIFTIVPLTIYAIISVEDISNLSSELQLILTAYESFMIGFGAFIFIYLVYKSNSISYNYFEHIYLKKLPMLKYIKWITISLVLLLLINFVLSILFSVLDLNIAENAVFDIAKNNPIYLLYLIPIMLFIVGPMEEFMFRGIIQGVFRDSYGVNISLLITSGIFGLIHIPAAGGLTYSALLYVLTAFSLGLLLGYIYEMKKSLLIPIIAHGLYNSILIIGAYIQMINMM